MMRSKVLLNIALILITSFSFGQSTDEQLAEHYFNQGDCEKAIPYFEKAYAIKPNDLIFNRYLSCLKRQGDEKGALQLITSQASKFPGNMRYQVALGEEYEQQNNTRRAERIFSDLIDNLSPSPSTIINLHKAFFEKGKYDWSMQTLNKGRQILKNSYPLNLQFAEVYGALNQTEDMIREYIELLDHSAGMLSTLKLVLPRAIDFEEEDSESFTMFRNELIRKIQRNPNEKVFSDLLIWAFVQRRNFSSALIQAKALDRRTVNDGREVYLIGGTALKNNDFSTARNAFKYIVDLGEGKPYYYLAEQLLLQVRFKEITSFRNYSTEEIEETIKEYKTTLSRLPKNGKSFPIIRELAYIQAYHANQAEKAIQILNEALNFPRYSDLEEARNKILLADIYVMTNEVWEASLLYMQVEKAFKYEQIGEEAKFKNARIFYYDGDFNFAQSQLDVLKQATSRLIANDAINLSILITDNLGLDSNYTAMRNFAKADLLLEQHRYEEAFALYDSITENFPNHNLKDDILMRRAQAHQNKGEWEEAIESLMEIVNSHAEDVLADDALYQIAQIYEHHLLDKDKAGEYYFQLMRDYPGSLYVVEARKAYRSIN